MSCPQLRPTVQVYKSADELVFYLPRTRILKKYAYDSAFEMFVTLIDGRRTVEEIHELMQLTHPSVSIDDCRSALLALGTDNLLVPEAGTEDTSQFRPRFQRQLVFFQEFGYKTAGYVSPARFQLALQHATVAIVGLGGLGSWVLEHLVRSGVGHLRLIDSDQVEESNLNRQLYAESDVGRPKHLAAVDRLKAIDPRADVQAYSRFVAAEDKGEWVQGCDLVISCADSPSVAAVGTTISNLCYDKRITHIVGGGYNPFFGFGGTSIIPGKTPCFACMMAERQRLLSSHEVSSYEGVSNRSMQNGALSVQVGILGSVIAMEAIRLLTDYEPPLLVGNFMDIDFSDLTMHFSTFAASQTCQICGENE